MTFPSVLAVLPVRDSALPAGWLDTVTEAEGRVLVIGSGALDAAEQVAPWATEVLAYEIGTPTPSRTVERLLAHLESTELVLLPASPDGRDIAPRLAHRLHRSMYAAAIEIRADRVTVPVQGGRVLEDHRLDLPAVVTVQIGIHGEPAMRTHPADIIVIDTPDTVEDASGEDAIVERVEDPDASTIDLAEAHHLWGGGAGVDSAERLERLGAVAARLGASLGATRVVTDRGWIDHERQIGTTGVVVSPRRYVAFGISGAVQHTSGLGHPDLIVSVNTDPHCPMMQMADLAIVADVNEVIEALDELTSGLECAEGAI